MTSIKNNGTVKATPFLLGIGLLILFTSPTYAQFVGKNDAEPSNFWADINTQHQVQVGIDTWSLRKNLGPAGYYENSDLLYLADSYPDRTYQSTAPWIKVNAEAKSNNKIFRLRYDNNQSVGSRIDELSMDWSHRTFGVRSGILSYKISWCRTHDMDSPWMRENDSFCTVRTNSTPIKSSPGLQAYVNSQISSFKIQSVAGIYRPMFLNYETQEFNLYANPNIHVVENNKYGMSINAIDLNNGLEVRLSYLQNQQWGNYSSNEGPTQRIDQNARWLFGAISANLSSVLNLRMSYLSSREHADFSYPDTYVTPGDTYPDVFLTLDRNRISSVLELNYQHNARNVLSVAYSHFKVSDKQQGATLTSPVAPITYTSVKNFALNNSSVSLGWRHNWQKGVFTVVQYTHAGLKQELNYAPGLASTQITQSTGKALGLRLGYAF